MSRYTNVNVKYKIYSLKMNGLIVAVHLLPMLPDSNVIICNEFHIYYHISYARGNEIH